jgi:iron complex outermembrane receptor protein
LKKLLFIAAAVLLPFIASAQFSISGKISDKNSGTALNGAIIRVENTYSSARSDASGN